jgi:hypothetical protein
MGGDHSINKAYKRNKEKDELARKVRISGEILLG